MEDIEKSASPERQILQVAIGVYEHYKSTPEDRRYYKVLGVARNTETSERYVVYVPMYATTEHADHQFEVRPLDMFTESVGHNGQTVPRFQYIGPEL